MKCKMSTDLLHLIDPGMYETELGDMFYSVPEEDERMFKDMLCSEGKDILDELFSRDDIVEQLGECSVSYVALSQPKFYNYSNDQFYFDLEIENSLLDRIKEKVDSSFFTWAEGKYHSYDGFISFMPYSPLKFMEACDGRDIERAVAMYIMYIFTEICNVDLESYQRDFIDNMEDICLSNGWYDDEEEDD